MSRVVIYPYKIYSASSRQLADAIRSYGRRCIRVYADRKYNYRDGDLIVNWGSSNVPEWDYPSDAILNKPEAVEVATNKLSTLEALSEAGVRVVPFTTDPVEARKWDLVVERHVLKGHSGEGIKFKSEYVDLERAPLYTKYLPGDSEYRVHVFNGEVIDYAKKVIAKGNETPSLIRSHKNGYVFIREVGRRESVQEIALEAIDALGLDFGAVDIIRFKKKCYVLEVGTAPGLSEAGLEAYAKNIIEYADTR